MSIAIDDFRNATKYGFSFYYERNLDPGETRYLKMPAVSPNKRGINDIGFAYESGISLYATLSEEPFRDNAIWQKINPFDEINKTVSYIKIENTAQSSAKVNIRAILN
mgnify:CR=1 FL=1